MKKLILILSFIPFWFIQNVYGEDKEVWMFPPSSYIQGLDEVTELFSFTSDSLNIQNLEGLKEEDGLYPYFVCDSENFYICEGRKETRIALSSLQTDENLYQRYWDGRNYEVAIMGGGYFATSRMADDYDREITARLIEVRNLLLTNTPEDIDEELFDTTFILPQVISRISLTVPFLKETIRGEEIVYDDDLLKYRWFYNWATRTLVMMYFVNDSSPMVEGAAGNGEGVSIDIDFHIPVDNVVVLNGFVDLERPHLYKRNARMKTVRVSGEGFDDFEYTFEDYVHFAQIDFPQEVKSVRLTVQDVYDGEKWDDMAISGLFVNPDILHTRNSDLALEYLEEAKGRYEAQ